MLNSLRKIVQEVTQEADFPVAVQLLVARVRKVLGTEVCSIYLVDGEDAGYLLAATEGLNAAQIGRLVLAKDQGLVGLVGRRAELTGEQQDQGLVQKALDGALNRRDIGEESAEKHWT